MDNSHTKKIVLMALLIAMSIVFTRFLRVETPTMRISLGFLPIAVMAMIFKPLFVGMGAAVADIVGFFMFSSGTFFPGFTLTAFLTGVIYWVFFHKQPVKMWQVCAAAVFVVLGLNFILDTYWLTILRGTGFLVILPERIIRTAIMLPLQIATLRMVTSERFFALIKQHAFPLKISR
jgi:ECF transporter S component (folate family)